MDGGSITPRGSRTIVGAWASTMYSIARLRGTFASCWLFYCSCSKETPIVKGQGVLLLVTQNSKYCHGHWIDMTTHSLGCPNLHVRPVTCSSPFQREQWLFIMGLYTFQETGGDAVECRGAKSSAPPPPALFRFTSIVYLRPRPHQSTTFHSTRQCRRHAALESIPPPSLRASVLHLPRHLPPSNPN